MTGWYVVSTQPHGEARAEANLVRQGFETWLPRFAKERRHARKVDTVLKALFPGYLFVRLDPETMRWRSINGTVGVRHIIVHDERPARLPDNFVESLKARTGPDGLVAPPDEETLAPGMRVRLTGGPFADQIATLVRLADRERVALLLSLLGREVTTTVPRSLVERSD